MATNNLIFNVCSQYRARQLFANPNNNRIEIENIPTRTIDNENNVTLEQLNMRRKAEILQYNPNRQSNQTNNYTKKQRYALLVSGNPRLNVKNIPINNNINQDIPGCSDDLTPVPTSSSDVPGPIMNLIYDKNIPLYNYINPVQTRGYTSVTDVLPNNEFKFNYSTNVFIPEGDTTNVMSMYFADLTETHQQVNLSFTIPIGIYIMGTISQTPIQYLTIIIYGITVGLYLNDGLISTINNLVNETSAIVFSLQGKTGNFKLLKYVGNIKATNFNVNVQQNMIYTLKVSYNIGLTGYNSNELTNITQGIIANMDYSTEVINNCTVTSSPSLSGYSPTFISDK